MVKYQSLDKNRGKIEIGTNEDIQKKFEKNGYVVVPLMDKN